MKMVCPRCHTGLARQWAGKVLIQLCPACRGISITRYALQSLAEPGAVNELWAQAVGENQPSGASCPSCLKEMILAHFDEEGKTVELDACTRCQLIWFDRGEYAGMNLEGPATTSALTKTAPPPIPPAPAPTPPHTLAEPEAPAVNPELPESGYGLGTVALALIGLPVEEEVGPLARYPVVTRGLVALVTLVSAWGFGHPKIVLEHYAFRCVANPGIFLLTSLSSFFFHAGLWHLLSNMYFFWVFGDDVESELGPAPYLALLTLATLGGNMLFCFTPGADQVAALGASGGVAGLIAYYMIRFPYRRFRVMFFFFVFTVRAWAAGAVYFLFEVIGAAAQLNGHGQVSHLSHLGGALVGALCALAVQLRAAAALARTR